MEPGGQKTDFRLVQSYIPFVEMISRAVLFAVLALQIRGVVAGHVFLTILFLIVYVDSLWHMSVHSSAIGMHLIPIAFMLSTADRDNILAISTNVHVALDALWACVCVLHYACSMMRVSSSYMWLRVLLIMASVLLHMPSTAYDMQTVEVCVRIVLFYSFCFVHYYVFSARVCYDTHTHTLVGPNVNLYILFVHPSVVVLAAFCKCCVICKMHFEESDKREPCSSKPMPAPSVSTMEDDMQELMMELRAAQSSKV
jgi:hypothetical protein